MQITYLGHAGFLVETRDVVLVMDPWLSPDGAFDSSWFQYPCNHHLADLVREKLADGTRQRFLYVSHEHKDHFDASFLKTLTSEEFTFLVPHFRRPVLRERLAEIPSQAFVHCSHGERVALPGGYARLFLDDSELNRDSAIFVRLDGQTFFNINDCKLHDQLHSIAEEEGALDAFAAQFSGATWHPTCYAYPLQEYERISRKKMMSKFEAVAQAIETVRPGAYLPSAGPPVFLDPILLEKNFEPVNIFPRAPHVLEWLGKRLKKSMPEIHMPEWMPGDVLDVAHGEIRAEAQQRVVEDDFESYVRAYAERYSDFFEARREQHENEQAEIDYLDRLQKRLCDALQTKLDGFELAGRIDRPLYFRLSDAPEHLLRVDFANGTATTAPNVEEKEFYELAAPSWELKRVLDGLLTWEDFALTFRMRLNRAPDIYQTLMQGFLVMEPEDLNPFCKHVLDLESRAERIAVEAGGCKYSINRICPHQGADLAEGWVEEDRYLVCSRHRWRFDLHNDGKAEQANESIHAIPLEED